MPEVFDQPPEIVGGFMAQETEDALLEWNPLVWGSVKRRGLFITGPDARFTAPPFMRHMMPLLRTLVFDRFGRRL
jgi:hypothetical protein